MGKILSRVRINKKYLFLGIIVVVLLGIFLGIYFSNNSVAHREFSDTHGGVGNRNVFYEVSVDEVLDIMKKDSSIVYFGYSDCEWCKGYVPTLNKAAKKNGVNKIYYCDVKKAAKNKESYKKLINLLGDSLHIDEDGKYVLYVPYVAFVKNGTVIRSDSETSSVIGSDTPEEYWTDEEKDELFTRLSKFIKTVK